MRSYTVRLNSVAHAAISEIRNLHKCSYSSALLHLYEAYKKYEQFIDGEHSIEHRFDLGGD